MWELWRKCRLKCQVVCGQYGQGRANAICTVMHRSQWANPILHASRVPSRTEISKWSMDTHHACRTHARTHAHTHTHTHTHTHSVVCKNHILLYIKMPSKNAHQNATSEINDYMEIGLYYLNQLRLSFYICFSETVLIYHSIWKKSSWNILSNIFFVFNRRKKVIQVAIWNMGEQMITHFQFFCMNYPCKHETWVSMLTNRVSVLPHFNDYILFSTHLYIHVLDWASMNMLVCQQQLSTSHHPHFFCPLTFVHTKYLEQRGQHQLPHPNNHTLTFSLAPSSHWTLIDITPIIPFWPVWASAILKLPQAVADPILLMY